MPNLVPWSAGAQLDIFDIIPEGIVEVSVGPLRFTPRVVVG